MIRILIVIVSLAVACTNAPAPTNNLADASRDDLSASDVGADLFSEPDLSTFDATRDDADMVERDMGVIDVAGDPDAPESCRVVCGNSGLECVNVPILLEMGGGIANYDDSVFVVLACEQVPEDEVSDANGDRFSLTEFTCKCS